MEPETLSQEQVSFTLDESVEILIVEDEKGHYLLTKIYLQKAGIVNNIVWFDSGDAVLDFLKAQGHRSNSGKKYIMLLDIRMPRVDGIEVLKVLKGDENLQSIPIIMLTTSDDQQLARQCYDLGCDGHIIKPPGEVLLRAIQRVGEKL